MNSRVRKLLSQGFIVEAEQSNGEFDAIKSTHRIMSYSNPYKSRGNDSEERGPAKPTNVTLVAVANTTDRLNLGFTRVQGFTKYSASLFTENSIGIRTYIREDVAITTGSASNVTTGSYQFTNLVANTTYYVEVVTVEEITVTGQTEPNIVLSLASDKVSGTTNSVVSSTSLKAKILAGGWNLKWLFSVEGALTTNITTLTDQTGNYKMTGSAPASNPTDTPSIVAGTYGTGNVIRTTLNTNGHGMTMRFMPDDTTALNETIDATDGFVVLIAFKANGVNGSRRLFSFVDIASNVNHYFRVETNSAAPYTRGRLRWNPPGATNNIDIEFEDGTVVGSSNPDYRELFDDGYHILLLHFANNVLNAGLYSGGTNGIGGTVKQMITNRAVNPSTFNFGKVGWMCHINSSNGTETPLLGDTDLFTLIKSTSVGGATPGSGMPTYEQCVTMIETAIAE